MDNQETSSQTISAPVRFEQKSNEPVSAARIPPHSIEAEQAVIGALLLDNSAWDRIAEALNYQDFYRFEHRLIFQVMMQLAEKSQPFDILTITEALRQVQQLEKAGGEVYLFELAHHTPSAANIHAYSHIVRERALQRQLISIGSDLVDKSFNLDGQDVKQLLDYAEQSVFRIAQNTERAAGPNPIHELLASATERLDMLFRNGRAVTGVATGFQDLDEMTCGLQPGDLIIVAGRPSMGKTAFSMNIAEHVAMKEQKPVLIFSMEMPAESLAIRMMSSLGRIDQSKVRTGRLNDDDWARISSAVGMLSEAKMFIDDSPALTPMEVRSRARRLVREHQGLGLIVIDYLQLMQIAGFRENRTNEISVISRSLKALAKELHVPIIALSQLNRGLESRPDKRPMMSDLRESGAIEQDADLIAFIYRDEVYNDESPDKGSAEIIIGKQRNGPIGKVRLTFLGKYTRFENYSAVAQDF